MQNASAPTVMGKAKMTYKEFEALLLRHQNRLQVLCRQYADNDFERRRDLMQEVTAALWERRARLGHGASFVEERLWVYWEARRVFSREMRHERRRLKTFHLGEEAWDVAAPEEESYNEQLQELAAGLSYDEQRLLEFMLMGYSGVEIASLMGISAAAVSKRQRRLMERLRENAGL